MTRTIFRSSIRSAVPPVPALVRTPIRQLSPVRLLKGGRVSDLGRLPRYAGVFALGAVCIWTPIASYLKTAPVRYTSSLSLILPGSGASASVNLDSIGQASSFASSPFASNSVSPTETYKRLIAADRIRRSAADSLGLSVQDFGSPRVDLVDQTSLIHVSVTGASPEDSQARGDALLQAFFREVETLRTDELTQRETSGSAAIEEYRQSVLSTRAEISELQKETGLISATQYDALVADADALGGTIRDLRARRDEAAEAVRTLEASLGVDASLAAAALRLHADTEFVALTAEMADHAAALAEAGGQLGANHPTIRAATSARAAAAEGARARARLLTGLPDDQIDRLDLSHVGSRADLLSRLVTREAERAGLEAELATQTERLEASEARKMDLIEAAARLEDLQRDFTVAGAVFASAMARTQTSKTDLYASYPLVQVLENPSLPEVPSSPKDKLALAAGVAATLFLLMGLLLGWIRRPLIGRLLADKPETAAGTPPSETAAPPAPHAVPAE
ncbi:hypothetical protein RM543_09780 [Roseicyclus sp. F158]|uniref:Uncharacterized protein n=1 Tax=Tropicimonas omnivorans TaxID=3075590 RepID=A0ABU3DGY6_9RHOB|nr:hypothetical protein [Roseicyclus sp. F158]MDT0682976.1 hypothetical protein [Roseicyclus sp. F158]